jgi:thiamine-monophosphate kinase
VVTGEFGGSILARHLDFEPRVEEAIVLTERYEVHAGIDVSDGLSLDLARVAQESGCGAVLDLAAVPIAEAARQLASQDGRSPLDHALGDGEDFELVLAVPPGEAERMVAEQAPLVRLTIVGEFIERLGLWRRDAQGDLIPLPARGFLHEFR